MLYVYGCGVNVDMDSDSDFECFPSSQISFCGYDNSQSGDFGGDVVDSDTEDKPVDLVSLENCDNLVEKCGGEQNKNPRIIYGNVEIEDISSDEDIDKL